MFNPLVSIYFESSRLEYKIQTNCITFQTVDPEIYSILIFFSVTSASTTFRIWYFKKIFLILYSNNWANFIVCLLLLLEMLNNMGIVIFCFPVDDVINFETFVSSHIPTWQRKPGESEEQKKAFKVKQNFLQEFVHKAILVREQIST